MLGRGMIVFILGLLLSCAQDKEQPMGNPTQIDKYFLLKDFVESQVNLLHNREVRKSIRIKGEEDYSSRSLSAEEWRKELDIFVQADINKASLALSYETIKKEGLMIHQLKPGEKSLIQSIKITYKENQVHRISFIAHQENIFYSSGTKGEMVVDIASGRIGSYQVSSMQKVWFLPANEIAVKGEIL